MGSIKEGNVQRHIDRTIHEEREVQCDDMCKAFMTRPGIW